MNKRLNNKNTCSTDLSGLLEGSNEIMHMKALCKLQSTIQMQITPSFGGNYYSNYYYYFHSKGGEEGEGMAPQHRVAEAQAAALVLVAFYCLPESVPSCLPLQAAGLGGPDCSCLGSGPSCHWNVAQCWGWHTVP